VEREGAARSSRGEGCPEKGEGVAWHSSRDPEEWRDVAWHSSGDPEEREELLGATGEKNTPRSGKVMQGSAGRTREKECLDVVWAMKEHSPLPHDQEARVVTDHKALQ
jgi:hypothetical protein